MPRRPRNDDDVELPAESGVGSILQLSETRIRIKAKRPIGFLPWPKPKRKAKP